METDNETEFAVALIDPGWLVERFITLCALFRFPDASLSISPDAIINWIWSGFNIKAAFFFQWYLIQTTQVFICYFMISKRLTSLITFCIYWSSGLCLNKKSITRTNLEITICATLLNQTYSNSTYLDRLYSDYYYWLTFIDEHRFISK